MSEALVLLCIFIGIFLRTLLPALRKWKEASDAGLPFTWDHRYTVTLVISAIISGLSALTLYQSFVAPVTDSEVQIGIAAVFFGFGMNSSIDELSKWLFDNSVD